MTVSLRLVTDRADDASPSADVVLDEPPAGPQPRLPWVALALGVVALLLAILPWTGPVASLVALAVSLVAWRRCARHRVPGAAAPRGLGVSQVATGLALAVLAITIVWTFVATVVPKPTQAPLDCTRPNLSEADRFQCQELQR